jgi:hypothetical protein
MTSATTRKAILPEKAAANSRSEKARAQFWAKPLK